MAAQKLLQPAATEVIFEAAEHALGTHIERRRPGRPHHVSPQLLPLLRIADNNAIEPEPAGTPEKISLLLAITMIASCSAALWFATIRMVMWLLG